MLGYIVGKACNSPRNLTWFTRPFLLVRGCGLEQDETRTRLAQGWDETRTRLAQGWDETRTRLAQGWDETRTRLAQGWDETRTRLAQGWDETRTRLAQGWDETRTRLAQGWDETRTRLAQGWDETRMRSRLYRLFHYRLSSQMSSICSIVTCVAATNLHDHITASSGRG